MCIYIYTYIYTYNVFYAYRLYIVYLRTPHTSCDSYTKLIPIKFVVFGTKEYTKSVYELSIHLNRARYLPRSRS